LEVVWKVIEPDVYVPAEGGALVSERQARIAEIIKDYDPELELAYIPPAKREPGDRAFAVVHRPLGRPAYVAFYADECDENLLARVFAGDNAKHDVMSDVAAKNAAHEALKLKKQMEDAEERKDLVQSIIKSPLNTYRHNGKVYQ
jgi:hypothetical protein